MVSTNNELLKLKFISYCSVVGYTLLLSLIEYKTLVLRGDFDRANDILPSIPKEQYDRCPMLYYLLYYAVQASANKDNILFSAWHISWNHGACWRKPLR
jgi:hypothetical protein